MRSVIPRIWTQARASAEPQIWEALEQNTYGCCMDFDVAAEVAAFVQKQHACWSVRFVPQATKTGVVEQDFHPEVLLGGCHYCPARALDILRADEKVSQGERNAFQERSALLAERVVLCYTCHVVISSMAVPRTVCSNGPGYLLCVACQRTIASSRG